MKTGIKVNGPDKEAVEATGDKLIDVIHACSDARLDRECTIEAIRAMSKAIGTTIANCYVGDNHK